MVFLKDFVLDEMEFILLVNVDLKVYFLEREMLEVNRDIFAKVHLISYEKLICYVNVFYLVNADLVRRKRFVLMLFVLHQLQQDMLCIELFLIYVENFHFLVYMKYHHSQEEAQRTICIWWVRPSLRHWLRVFL